MSRIDAMDSLANNKKAVIYGDQGQNLLANMEIFKTVLGK